MKRLFIPIIAVFLIFSTTSKVHAQQPGASFFNLDQLFNMDIGQLFEQLETEMEANKGIWSQFFGEAMMDSSMTELKSMVESGMVDSIMGNLQLQIDNLGMGDFDQLIQQLMNQFGSGGLNNILPMPAQPSTPNSPNQNYNNGEWDIVPNIPAPAPKAKPKVDPKKVSDI